MGLLGRFFEKVKPGLYSYKGRASFGGLSLQLRVEDGGEGVLAINANTVLYMNETATAHAYFFIKGFGAEEAAKAVSRMYKVSKEEAKKDHERFLYAVNTLANTEEVCPISYLGVGRLDPFTRPHSAPMRMDLALTFRCQNDCLHCYAGGPREVPELTTSEWMRAMRKIKDAAIFTVTFTGGEPTLREDLPELVRFAEDNGLVTGLVTNGRRFSDMKYVQTLSDCGLDFAQITIESHVEETHDKMTRAPGSWAQTVKGIENALSSEIYVSTNTTLTKLNVDHAVQTLEFVRGLGVENFSCNGLIYSGRGVSSSGELSLPVERVKAALSALKERSEALGVNFTWFTPTRYCELNPVNMGLGIRSCSAAMLNMCVGPNGDVYPCQSYFQPVGNILRDSWKDIWNNPLCSELRERKYAPRECLGCPDLKACGAGCPLEKGGAQHACQRC